MLYFLVLSINLGEVCSVHRVPCFREIVPVLYGYVLSLERIMRLSSKRLQRGTVP